MSAVFDVNILVYACDAQNSLHQKAKRLIADLPCGEDVMYLTWDICYSVYRIVTHPGIFKNPLSPSEAMQNLHYLINHQDVEILSHDQKSWSIFHRLQEELHIRGNLTADAQTAAILEANGIRKIFTTDSDFMKFSYLHPINPFK